MTVGIKEKVRQFMSENFMVAGAADIPDEASFMDRHLIDSTGFLELIAFIERSFDISVTDSEMIPENLDSLNNIERYVREKRAAA